MQFVTHYQAPEKRKSYVAGGIEHRFSEAAVMLAYAFHLVERGAEIVAVHPDGEHAKIFDIVAFLMHHGFERYRPLGTTAYGGEYRRGGNTILVNPRSGQGDVVGTVDGRKVVAECKGGTINSKHAGQKSRLRKGLAELIGQLMIREADPNERQVAVLPYTPEVQRLTAKLVRRCASAGIEIAMVESDGTVRYANAL